MEHGDGRPLGSLAVISRRATATLTLVVLTGLAACGGGDDDAGASGPETSGGGRATSGGELVGPAPEGIDGVQAYDILSNDHTEDDLDYQLSPPVGGDHFPVPGTCGYYETEPPPDEMLVHDLEHGAVWVAYTPDLDAAQKSTLSGLVAQQAKVTATPHDDLASPVVVSAWGRQLALDSVDDPRLQQFIDTYRNNANAPEPDAACQGVGSPAVASPTA